MKTFIINYKAYKEGIDNGIEIAIASREAAEKHKADIILAVPFTLCRGAAKITKSISQGIDPVEPGAFTGKVSWYEILKSGCKGSLINHSENRMPFEEVEKAVKLCKLNSLESYVCVSSPDEVESVARLNPTAISYEPSELIGAALKGDGASVVTKEKAVQEFVKMVKDNSGSFALIGAGIKDAVDVKKAIELGCDGILVSSVIMKGDFRKKIEELAGAL
jgi:triosephosphate isomerase (TIM)